MSEPNRLQRESRPNVMREAPTADTGVVRATRARGRRAHRVSPGRAPRSARGEQTATELSRDDLGVDWLLSGFTPLSLLVAVLGAEAFGLMFFLAAPTPEKAVGPLALFVLPPAALGFVSGLWLGRWGALATLLTIPIVYAGGNVSGEKPPEFEQYVFWWLVMAAPIAIGWVAGWATGIRLARLDHARPRRVGVPSAGVSRPSAAGGRRVGRTTSWPTTRRSPFARRHSPTS